APTRSHEPATPTSCPHAPPPDRAGTHHAHPSAAATGRPTPHPSHAAPWPRSGRSDGSPGRSPADGESPRRSPPDAPEVPSATGPGGQSRHNPAAVPHLRRVTLQPRPEHQGPAVPRLKRERLRAPGRVRRRTDLRL